MNAVTAWANFPFPGAWAVGLLVLLAVLALLLTSEQRAIAREQRRGWDRHMDKQRQRVRAAWDLWESVQKTECRVVCRDGNLTFPQCMAESTPDGVLLVYTRESPADSYDGMESATRVLRTFGRGEWLSYENVDLTAPAPLAQDDPD